MKKERPQWIVKILLLGMPRRDAPWGTCVFKPGGLPLVKGVSEKDVASLLIDMSESAVLCVPETPEKGQKKRPADASASASSASLRTMASETSFPVERAAEHAVDDMVVVAQPSKPKLYLDVLEDEIAYLTKIDARQHPKIQAFEAIALYGVMKKGV